MHDALSGKSNGWHSRKEYKVAVDGIIDSETFIWIVGHYVIIS